MNSIELNLLHGVKWLIAIAIALSFPEQDEHKRREKLFSELPINDLKTDIDLI